MSRARWWGPLFTSPSDDCVSDADCAGGTLCIASVGLRAVGSSCEGVTRDGVTFIATLPYFACQTAEDECGADAQCGPSQSCADWPTGRRCEVYQRLGCGVPGRPFLVADEARVASVRRGTDWAGPPLPVAPDLDPSARAALEAAEALASATDPEVRATLELIARAERRHAELAWRFIAWALERDATGELRQVLRQELQAELQRLGAHAASGSSERAGVSDTARAVPDGPPGARAGAVSGGTDAEVPVLARHGHMGGDACRALSRAALNEVVLPCAERLLARDAEAAREHLPRPPASA